MSITNQLGNQNYLERINTLCRVSSVDSKVCEIENKPVAKNVVLEHRYLLSAAESEKFLEN